MDILSKMLFEKNINISKIQEQIAITRNLIAEKQKFVKDAAYSVDYMLLLSCSMDYSRIPLLIPLLSKPIDKVLQLPHLDTGFLNALLKAGVKLPFIDPTYISKVVFEDEFFFLSKMQCREKYTDDERFLKFMVYSPVVSSNFVEKFIRKDTVNHSILFDHGIDANFMLNVRSDRYKFTKIPLISYAALCGSVRWFKYLLLNGADLKKRAIYSCRTLVYGCDKIYNNVTKYTTSAYAALGGNIEIIKLIEQHIGIDEDFIKVIVKFHLNQLLDWVIGNGKINDFLLKVAPQAIKYNNYRVYNILMNNYIDDMEHNIPYMVKCGTQHHDYSMFLDMLKNHEPYLDYYYKTYNAITYIADKYKNIRHIQWINKEDPIKLVYYDDTITECKEIFSILMDNGAYWEEEYHCAIELGLHKPTPVSTSDEEDFLSSYGY